MSAISKFDQKWQVFHKSPLASRLRSNDRRYRKGQGTYEAAIIAVQSEVDGYPIADLYAESLWKSEAAVRPFSHRAIVYPYVFPCLAISTKGSYVIAQVNEMSGSTRQYHLKGWSAGWS